MNDLHTNTVSDPATNCLLWMGPVSSLGDPVEYPSRIQRGVAHARFADGYGIHLPKGILLRRVCGMKTCVAPWHSILRGSQKLAKGLRASRWHMARVRGAIRRRQAESAESGIWWDAGDLRRLAFQPSVAHDLAMKLDVHIYVVLAAYAGMVTKTMEVTR